MHKEPSMHVSDAIAERRAVKGFDPEHCLSEMEVENLLKTALLAPSAFNIQHVRVVWIRDPELRRQIRAAAWDQDQVTSASALFVIAADLKAWKKNPAGYWEGAPQPVLDFILPAIHAYYADRPAVERDECMRSMGLFGMALMLLAKDMGLDSCPMDGFDFDAVAELINLPPDHVIGFMIAVGRKIREPWPRIGKLSLDKVLARDGF